MESVMNEFDALVEQILEAIKPIGPAVKPKKAGGGNIDAIARDFLRTLKPTSISDKTATGVSKVGDMITKKDLDERILNDLVNFILEQWSNPTDAGLAAIELGGQAVSEINKGKKRGFNLVKTGQVGKREIDPTDLSRLPFREQKTRIQDMARKAASAALAAQDMSVRNRDEFLEKKKATEVAKRAIPAAHSALERLVNPKSY